MDLSGNGRFTIMSEADNGKATSERPKRRALMTTATFAHEGGGTVRVRVRNLSETGLGGTATMPLTKGETYCVELKGIGEVRGTIMWVAAERFGMEFERPINLDRLEMTDLADVKIHSRKEAQPHYPPPGDFKRPGFRTR